MVDKNEVFALMALVDHCKENPNDYVYYSHSKGGYSKIARSCRMVMTLNKQTGTSTKSSTVKYKLAKPWRQVMQHFLFHRWQSVVSTVSCNNVEQIK